MAYEQGGADVDAGDFAAHLLDELDGLSACDMAVHESEDVVAAVLEGYVEVFADVVSLAHDAKQVVGEVGGVGVVEAYPFDAGDVGDAFYEFGYLLLFVEVGAVEGDFLFDYLKFFDSAAHEFFDFFYDVFHGAGFVSARYQGDGAVGAAAVAAFAYLDEGVVGGGGEVAAVGVSSVYLVAEVGYEVEPVEFAVEFVDFGDGGCEFGGVAAGEAAHDVELVEAAFGLGLAELEYHVDGLFFGVADEAAGVDDRDVSFGVFGFVGDSVACLLQLKHEPL